MRSRSFNKDYLLQEFKKIDAELDRRLQIYLIGGGAMSLKGIKEATKDVDIVATTMEEAECLAATLRYIGYREVLRPRNEYVEMGALFILENTDGFRWDIFVAQVMRRLVFSENMRGRARGFGGYERLGVKVASNTDIFLLKSITEREGDLEDMSMLVRSGIDSEILLQEVENQKKLLGKEMWVTYLSAKLAELEDRYGITLPVRREINNLEKQVYDKLEVILLLKKREMDLEELEHVVNMGRKELDEALSELLSREIIKRVDEKFKVISDTL